MAREPDLWMLERGNDEGGWHILWSMGAYEKRPDFEIERDREAGILDTRLVGFVRAMTYEPTKETI